MTALQPPSWLGYPEYTRVDTSIFVAGNCPVCGEENGNCKGNGEYEGHMVFEPKKRPSPDATYSVPERVYTEEKVGTRTIRKLLYGIGDRITVAEARRVGLLK